MARQRSHSIEFKRQVAEEFIAGESLFGLSKRHDISRQLIRVWVEKYGAGALDEAAQASIYSRKTEPRVRRWSAWLSRARASKSSLPSLPFAGSAVAAPQLRPDIRIGIRADVFAVSVTSKAGMLDAGGSENWL